MVEESITRHLSDRSLRLGVTRRQNPLVVSSAVSLGLAQSWTIVDRAEVSWFPQRLLADRPLSKQSLIVAMAIAPSLGILVAGRCGACRLLSRDRAGRSRISRSQHPPVMHFAHAPGIRIPGTVLNGAGIHGVNVSVAWDRNRNAVTSDRGSNRHPDPYRCLVRRGLSVVLHREAQPGIRNDYLHRQRPRRTHRGGVPQL